MFNIDFASANDDVLAQRSVVGCGSPFRELEGAGSLAHEKLKGNLHDWEKYIWQFLAQLCNPSVQDITISTSGSTGSPKEIKHTKQAVFNSAKMTCETLNLKPGNSVLLCLPANKIGGMMMLARCLCNKMNLYCVKPSSNPLKDLNQDVKIDFASFTPMQFHEILSDETTAKRAETIPKILLGGQTTEWQLEQKIRKMTNDVYLTFAMTETISHIALKKLTGKNPDRHYTLLPGIKITVDDRNCMIIDAPKLGCTHLVTNDIIRIISNKQFEWLGRWDNVINSGGIKIYPEELEQKLLPCIKPAFFIAALPDSKLGQKLVIVIEAENFSKEEINELTTALEQFDKMQRPKEILLVKTFVRTENGKIKREESLKATIDKVAL